MPTGAAAAPLWSVVAHTVASVVGVDQPPVSRCRRPLWPRVSCLPRRCLPPHPAGRRAQCSGPPDRCQRRSAGCASPAVCSALPLASVRAARYLEASCMYYAASLHLGPALTAFLRWRLVLSLLHRPPVQREWCPWAASRRARPASFALVLLLRRPGKLCPLTPRPTILYYTIVDRRICA